MQPLLLTPRPIHTLTCPPPPSYIVINPNSGPLNTSDPTGANGGFCNVGDDTYHPLDHGCNRDWTTHLAAINALPNAQTIGYIYTQYGARNISAIKADIAEWAAWHTAPTWTNSGDSANISIAGLWFDEVGAHAEPGNATLITDLVAYANATFAAAREAQGIDDWRDRAYTVVLNAGPVANASYEAQLFSLADAVVTKETCYTSDPSALGAAVVADCPEPYAPFDVAALEPGNGLPHDAALTAQAVVIVHQFVGPPEADLETLRAQVRGVMELGVHSAYFTSGSWHQTTLTPATIGNVSGLLNGGDGATESAASSIEGVELEMVRWAVGMWVVWHLRQSLAGLLS